MRVCPAGSRLPLIVCAMIGLMLPAPAAAQDVSEAIPNDIGARVVAAYIQPATDAFSTATEDLVAAMRALCAEPADPSLDDARNAFAAAVTAWGRLSILRFGPLVADNRFERLFFWPDPRGVTLRQVQELLANEDAGALSPSGLQEKSVALQGLPALEFVLHGSGAEALGSGEGGYRCRYGLALSGNLAKIASEVKAGWAETSPFVESFTRPAAESNPYRSPQEVAGEVIKALGTGLQYTSNAEIKPALGAAPENANGNRAPLRRADLTFTLIGAQLEGMTDLLTATGWPAATADGIRPIADSVAFDLDRAREAIGSIDRPAEEAFELEDEWETLRYVTIALDFANRTVSERLAGALGLMMGFNALDGD